MAISVTCHYPDFEASKTFYYIPTHTMKENKEFNFYSFEVFLFFVSLFNFFYLTYCFTENSIFLVNILFHGSVAKRFWFLKVEQLSNKKELHFTNYYFVQCNFFAYFKLKQRPKKTSLKRYNKDLIKTYLGHFTNYYFVQCNFFAYFTYIEIKT